MFSRQRASVVAERVQTSREVSEEKDATDPLSRAREQVPALVMRSVENARVALEDGKVDNAIKMMKSTDALCSRVVAPPTIHGLALRVLADAYVQKAAGRGEGEAASAGETEGASAGESSAEVSEEGDASVDYVALAKKALNRGIDICKMHEGRAGMPPFMVADLAGRMGDLYAALGEIFREEGNYKEALRALRQGILRFEQMASNDFIAATYNRVAYCYMEKEQWKEALDELQSAERAASGAESEAAIMSTTFAYRGRCFKALNKIESARAAFESALNRAMTSGNEPVVREAEEFLAETQAHSVVDDSAFL